jgi:hypothetical protein
LIPPTARSSPRRKDFRTKHIATARTYITPPQATVLRFDKHGFDGGIIKVPLRFAAGSFRYV